MNGDGTYNIEYDGGGGEVTVTRANVREVAGTFAVGDVIEARYEDEWLGGIIDEVNSDGTYSIEYDFGFTESHVSGAPALRLRWRGVALTTHLIST